MTQRTPRQLATFGPSPVQRITTPGLLVPGNINLHNRPTVRNLDGSISTVRSITVTDGRGHAYLIPTVIKNPSGVGGRVVSNQQAVQHFQRTGRHLGVFTNESAADRYAQRLHEAQAAEYLPRSRRRTSALARAASGKPLP